MKRELKFRVWDTENKKFLTGYKEISRSFYLSGNGYELEHKNEIWQQFTGLKDKNGKEIYEGDIVKCLHGVESIGIVEYFSGNGFTPDTCFFGVRNEPKKLPNIFQSDDIYELIGNIFIDSEMVHDILVYDEMVKEFN